MRIIGHAIAVPAGFAGKPVTVDFYDLRGRIVKRILAAADKPLSFSERGLYLVKCSAGGDAVVQKYINLR
jgi:hypothetical protein